MLNHDYNSRVLKKKLFKESGNELRPRVMSLFEASTQLSIMLLPQMTTLHIERMDFEIKCI